MLLELVRDEDPSLVEERQRDDGLGDVCAITVDGASNSRRTRRPRVLLHELAVRGDRVVADGLYGGTAKVGAPTMDVSSRRHAFRLDTDENCIFWNGETPFLPTL